MLKKVSILLDEKDVVDIEMAVRDEDSEAALEIARRLFIKIELDRQAQCGQGTPVNPRA